MEYLFGLLGVIVGSVLSQFIPPLWPHKDKGAREAIIALGKEFNRDVHIYDYVGPLVHVRDWDKEAYVTKMTLVEARKNVANWNARVDGVQSKVDRLMHYLGVTIETTPAKTQIVKVKKR